MEKAIHYFGAALEIASSHSWYHELFWTRYSLARLLSNQGKLGDANAQFEQAKSHAVDRCGTYLLTPRRSYRLSFGINNIGLKRLNPKYHELSMCLRSSGPRVMRRMPGRSSSRSAVTLKRMDSRELDENGEPFKIVPLVSVYWFFTFMQARRIQIMISMLASSSLDITLSRVLRLLPSSHPLLSSLVSIPSYASLFPPLRETLPFSTPSTQHAPFHIFL